MKGENARARLAEIEARLRTPLPASYSEYLIDNPNGMTGDFIVTSDPEYLGVDTIFGLDCPEWMRADIVYADLDDVLPSGGFPVARDIGGNLYLIECKSGATCGHISWWNHERDLDDWTTEPVSESFAAFMASLIPAED